MRRFITSLPGKAFSHLVILALLLPTLTFALLHRAVAQIAQRPSWAVVEFRNLKSPGTSFGKTAAEAVASELVKTDQYDITPQETVNRALADLGVTSPPERVNLLRIGQQLRSSTIVSGDIVDYRITTSGGQKSATVQLAVAVTDVASGLNVNGALVTATSTVRPSSAADDTLVADAITVAVSDAIREIQSRQLPSGTVLNTLSNSALINQGARAGFKNDQKVIVLRGREQVATATVFNVEPDSSYIRFDRVIKGIKPGDKVRAVFSAPEVVFNNATNTATVVKPKQSGDNSGIITVLLILGLVAALMSRGGGSNPDAIGAVYAESQYDITTNNPAIRVSWNRNGFTGGSQNVSGWNVWRQDINANPVWMALGVERSYVDRTTGTNNYNWFNGGGIVGGTLCNNTASTNASVGTANVGITAGSVYTYSVELVYALSPLDLPDGGTTGGTGTGGGTTGGVGGNTGGNTGGTTGGGTTGGVGGNTGGTTGGNTGGTTGGNTGGTGGTGSAACYFVSSRTFAAGQATAITVPSLNSPTEGTPISGPAQFTWNSVVLTTPFNAEYVLQMSDQVNFPRGRVWIASTRTESSSGIINSGSIDVNAAGVPAFIRTPQNAQGRVYWRVGARNSGDRPGPVPDASTGERYVFTLGRYFTRPGGPPPPPSAARRGN